MGQILVTHPLIILYLFYVLCMLPVLLWPDIPQPPRQVKGDEPRGACGTQGRIGFGSRLRRPPTTPTNLRQEKMP
jgi:hypothetical protein